jgi:hypothetical protein
LAEAGMGSFEECAEALRKFNLDEISAFEFLINKNLNSGNQ